MNPQSLIFQLQQLITKLDKGNLNTQQIEIIQEFILKINFTEYYDKKDKDLMKYLSIGWFICENFNKI